MKVMCINDRGWVLASDYNNTDGPKYGTICTVIEDDGDCYSFLEYGAYEYYLKDCFIPLSDISETEFIRNYQTQPA